jgi:predicted NUDIX family NTP pyrophosphohydrolase
VKKSAGLLLFRRVPASGAIEVFLVHPGGPFFARKDEGYWSIPKGLVESDEPDLDAARREFAEETSLAVADSAEFLDLGEVRQKGPKLVRAWAFEGDCDPDTVKSNTFEMEWPPKSGRMRAFPEIDRAAWFGVEDARRYMNAEQLAFVERLVELLRQ